MSGSQSPSKLLITVYHDLLDIPHFEENSPSLKTQEYWLTIQSRLSKISRLSDPTAASYALMMDLMVIWPGHKKEYDLSCKYQVSI